MTEPLPTPTRSRTHRPRFHSRHRLGRPGRRRHRPAPHWSHRPPWAQQRRRVAVVSESARRQPSRREGSCAGSVLRCFTLVSSSRTPTLTAHPGSAAGRSHSRHTSPVFIRPAPSPPTPPCVAVVHETPSRFTPARRRCTTGDTYGCAATPAAIRTPCCASTCLTQVRRTGMVRVPAFGVGTGTVMVSTPSSYSAVALSSCDPAGSRTERAKVP